MTITNIPPITVQTKGMKLPEDLTLDLIEKENQPKESLLYKIVEF